MVEESEFDKDPEKTAYHANKRELLKRGKEQGELSWKEITDSLPEEFFNDVEMEVFLFTCKNMDIEVKGGPQQG